jgi:hypothetical protein
MATSEPKIERAHCNECGHKTKHYVVGTRVQRGSELYQHHPYDPGVELEWSTTYDLLECCGCETVSIKRTYWFSEFNPGEEEVEYYPPRLSRRPPNWLKRLPEDVQALMQEVYAALQADSRRLAMMGARAVLDVFIVSKVGDVGSFQKKLDALQQEGYVSSRNRKVLEAALDVGSAAAHRGHQPDVEEVNQVIDIVENVLHADLLEPSADQLKQSTPPRPAKQHTKPKTAKAGRETTGDAEAPTS